VSRQREHQRDQRGAVLTATLDNGGGVLTMDGPLLLEGGTVQHGGKRC